MVAFVTTMPSGIQGTVSRVDQAVIESQVLNPSLPFPTYGVAYKIAAGKMVPIVASDAAAVIQGFLVRPYPVQNNVANEALSVNLPLTTGIGNGLRSGYMTVICQLGTASLGAPVYIRNASPSGQQIIGGIESGSTANNVLLPNAQFQGPADSAGNVEISFQV